MYYILKQDTKDWGGLIKQLKKRYMARCKHSCNQRNAFGIATFFAGHSIREFIFLSKKMCCDDPRMSWVTSRKQCTSEEEFLAKIDEKIDEQIKNRKITMAYKVNVERFFEIAKPRNEKAHQEFLKRYDKS